MKPFKVVAYTNNHKFHLEFSDNSIGAVDNRVANFVDDGAVLFAKLQVKDTQLGEVGIIEKPVSLNMSHIVFYEVLDETIG